MSDWALEAELSDRSDWAVETRPMGGLLDSSYRYTQLTNYAGPSGIWLVSYRAGATWDPARDGPIHSLRMSLAGASVDETRQTVRATQRVVVAQDDTLSWTEPPIVATYVDGWQALEWDETDLRSFLTTEVSRLDLTVGGSPITFGFANGASSPGGDTDLVRHHGTDDWRVEVIPCR